MKKKFYLFLLMIGLVPCLKAIDYGPYKQLMEINFEDGTVNDSLGNITTSLLNSATVMNDATRGGKVLQFYAATKGCLQLLDSPIADTMTVSFWGKREDLDPSQAWRMFMAFYAPDGGYAYLTPLTEWDSNSYLVLNDVHYGVYKTLYGSPVSNQTWYHFAIVFNGNRVRYFVDGALQAEIDILSPLTDFNLNAFYFGCNPDLNYPMTGRIDDIEIYHSALASNQVEALYQGLPLPEPDDNTAPTLPVVEVSVQADSIYQTIHNFGASDAWNIQPIGIKAPESKKEDIARLLFSKDTLPDGTPEGVGLSSWRFNIGAGTYEQGDASRITDPSHRTECFLNPDMVTYDWNKQAGQQWFLNQAVNTYQIEHIIGWQDSPPVYFNVRGLGFQEYGDPMGTILSRDHFLDFGNFLADVVLHFKGQGINFDYISPLNEPQWNWGPSQPGGTVSQEGSSWSNQDIHDVVKSIDTAFVNKGVDAKIAITESGDIDYLLQNSTGFASDQLYQFWNPADSFNLTGLPSFSTVVSSHSYWTDSNDSMIVQRRQLLAEQMKTLDPDLQYWQTEYSLLGSGYQFGHENGSARMLSPMECGISFARIIHNDITEGGATGWQWWTSMEFDSRNGAEGLYSLITFGFNSDSTDILYHPSKLLYTLGNYSRFVRPGMKRIGITRQDGMDAIEAVTNQMFSAYTDGTTLVVVAVNATTSNVPVQLSLTGLPEGATVEYFIPYVTSNDPGDNLRRDATIAATAQYTMPPTSVVTFVGKILERSTAIEPVPEKSFRMYPNPASEEVYIESAEPMKRITVTDLTGKKLIQVQVGDVEQVVLPVSRLQKGIYLLSVQSGKTERVQKLIINN